MRVSAPAGTAEPVLPGAIQAIRRAELPLQQWRGGVRPPLRKLLDPLAEGEAAAACCMVRSYPCPR